ncbi:MAG: FHA domain-containing protein [Chloroflexi bacterium]|nr:FHA domain-containing protein [Chloroflexota bacterium]
MRIRLLWIVGLAFGLWAAVTPQVEMPPPLGPQATLRQLRMTAYPEVEAWVAVQNPEGYFIAGLTADDFTVWEEDQTYPVEQVGVVRPGMQIVIALNPARTFAVRDNQGVSRFDYIYYQMESWLRRAPAQHYDLSLVTSTDLEVRHTDDPRVLLDALTTYREQTAPHFRELEPQIEVLERALRLATEPSPRGHLAREVLFITAPPLPEQVQLLPELAQRAREAGVRVSVWMVGHRDWMEMPQTEALQQFVQATGGYFELFSGQEVLPDLHEFFTNREQVYRLIYATSRKEPGPVNVRIAARTPYGLLTTEGQYEVTLQPPEVRWEHVPQEVVRTAPDPETPRSEWRPTEVRLTISVSFPDETPRDVVKSTLFVDGKPVQTQTQPPFERFLWDLRDYTQDGTHELQVEVEDALGLVGRTPPTEVQIRLVGPTPVARPGRPTPEAIPSEATATPVAATAPPSAQGWPSSVVIAVGAAGLVLLAALGWGLWRYRPTWPKAWLQELRLPWAKKAPTGSETRVWAVLEPLPPLQPGWPVGPRIELRSAELILGADPAIANVVLNDPSVSPRHARLWRDAQGRVFLADLQSVAGTWVNYTPITTQGVALEEDDIVYIGRFGFRVRLGPDLTADAVPPSAEPRPGIPEPGPTVSDAAAREEA